jgi:hypothetical protein
MIGTSTHLEWFLLKRKLMGPCWLRIKPDINPRKSSEALEVRFESVQVQPDSMPATACLHSSQRNHTHTPARAHAPYIRALVHALLWAHVPGAASPGSHAHFPCAAAHMALECNARVVLKENRSSPFSWCKFEAVVEDPKNITKLEAHADAPQRATPPLCVMALQVWSASLTRTHRALRALGM